MSNIPQNDGSEERLSKGSATIFDLAFQRFLKALEAGSNISMGNNGSVALWTELRHNYHYLGVLRSPMFLSFLSHSTHPSFVK